MWQRGAFQRRAKRQQRLRASGPAVEFAYCHPVRQGWYGLTRQSNQVTRDNLSTARAGQAVPTWETILPYTY